MNTIITYERLVRKGYQRWENSEIDRQRTLGHSNQGEITL